MGERRGDSATAAAIGSCRGWKPAVAQSVAEDLKGEELLGAVLFFPAQQSAGPNTVIPTLIYQLATRIPEY